MEPSMDVSALVAEMQETLATIHATLASLDPSFHEKKLEELEKKRDDAIQALSTAFAAESEALAQKRKAEREQIAERRRKEDEERERRRREEDDELVAREREEDEKRSGRLKEDTEEIEQDMDNLMDEVEEEARLAITEGNEKLKALQERRRELNRLIEEQLEKALPTLHVPVAPTRGRRRLRRTSPSHPAMSAESKQHESARATEPVTNAHQVEEASREMSTDLPHAERPDKHGGALQPGTISSNPDLTTQRIGHAPAHHPGTIEPTPAVDNLAQAQIARSEPDESPVLGVYDGELDGPSKTPTPITTGDAEGSETPWPLPDIPARGTSKLVHELTPADLGFQQPRNSASEASLSKLSADEGHQIGIFAGTMSHGLNVPGAEDAEPGTGLSVGKRDSSEAINLESAEPGAPLQGENFPQPANEGQAHHQDHDNLALPPIPEEATSQGSSDIATAIHSPVPEGPVHRPEVLMAITELSTAPSGLDNFYDQEEASSESSPDIESREGDVYPHVSEASGPARAFHRDDSGSFSGYLSEDADVQDKVFNHPGEPYIEEGDVGGTEHLHPGVPVTEGDEHDADHENLPRAPQLPTPLATPEPGRDFIQGATEGHGGGKEGEEEAAHTAEQGQEDPWSSREENKHAEKKSDSDHERSSEPEHHSLPEHHTSQLQPTDNPDVGPLTPKPSRDGPGLPEGHVALAGEGEDRREYKELARSRSPSPVHYNDYGTSPEPSDDGHGEPEHGKLEGHDATTTLESRHGADSHSSEEDAEFDRFVTPLPSHQSLRSFSQAQMSVPHNAGTDDYMEHHQAPDDSRRYELEHQHATTVHGEDDLFEDDEQSEDLPGSEAKAIVEDVHAGEQGTPGLRRSAEPRAEEHMEGDHERKTPRLTLQSSSPPVSVVQGRSLADEVNNYLNDEEGPKSQPGTPKQQETSWFHEQESHDTSPARSPQQPSSPASHGHVTSRHEERPQTPTGQESVASSEYVTPDTLAARDVNNVTWRANDGWTPQSMRTQTTMFSSPPTSPPHDKPEPKPDPLPESHLESKPPSYSEQPYSRSPLTEHGVNNEETETKSPASLMAPWRRGESSSPQHDPDISSTRRSMDSSNEEHKGSLFQRMRNIFEQPRSKASSNRDSMSHPIPNRSRPSSGQWFSDRASQPDITSPTQRHFPSLSSPTIPPHSPGEVEDERSALLTHPSYRSQAGQN
ncbi:hypothetical protein VTI74DRAFT_3430 [Chaetomium olivicolor]